MCVCVEAMNVSLYCVAAIKEMLPFADFVRHLEACPAFILSCQPFCFAIFKNKMKVPPHKTKTDGLGASITPLKGKPTVL